MAATQLNLAKGELIFREGDAPGSAYLIESGEVAVTAELESGPVLLKTLGPGELLGEMAVIDDAPRTATATAASDCSLIEIRREQLRHRLDEADPILRLLVRGLLARYRGGMDAVRGRGPGQGAAAEAGGQEGFDKMRLEFQLREALDTRSLQVVFQPILEIATDTITGFEALTRWHHPERGAVSPAEFINLAEETSLIVPVGRYVLARVCEALASWRSSGLDPLPFVAVNISARQLEDGDPVAELLSQARAQSVDPALIKMEITESLALNPPRVAEFIARCRPHGVKVALDDFGTGYSNLGHLHALAFDTIKLDQSFVRRMLDDPRSMAIVRAIVTMGHELGADFVAEGVETPEQLHSLAALGCRYAQGFHIGRGVGADEALERCAQQHVRAAPLT